MLKVNGISKAFGRNQVLRGISFLLGRGELVGLVGPSGGGKSVLLKIIGSVLEPDSGTIEGEQLSTGFLFQEGALFDSLTVLENTAYPLSVTPTIFSHRERGPRSVEPTHTNYSREEAFEKSLDILREVGLSKAVDKLPGQLSGGMRRRAALARALVSRPELVLLDDPTGGLDPVASTVIIDLIKHMHKQYQPSVVMVSHDIRRLLPNVDRVLALFDGSIATDLPTSRLHQEGEKRVIEFLSTRFDFDAYAPA